MLPPVHAYVLERNPQFAQFHKHLSLSILNPDGSTKPRNAPSDNSAKSLHALRVHSAKLQLLRSSLSEVTGRLGELPDELLEVVEIISTQLNLPYSLSGWDLLQEDVDIFGDHIQAIAKAVSDQLNNYALQLVKIVHCTENISAKPSRNAVSNLPHELATRRAEMFESQESLLKQRLALGQLACRVLEAHKELLETMIRCLEQTKHGSVSRGLKAQAEHLAVLGETMDGKLRLLENEAVSQIYTSDVQSALRHYHDHLQDTMTRLQQRRKTAKELLSQYESAGPGMSEIALRYSQFQKDIEAARADIRRLGGEA